MALHLQILETVTDAGNRVNDDRVGGAGALAWVIDGATDVVDERLLPGESDAAWYAAALDDVLRLRAVQPAGDFSRLIPDVTIAIAERFAEQCLRRPEGPHELPSAAGIVAELNGAVIDYVSLADCQLIVWAPEAEPRALGIDPETEAGDPAAVAIIQEFQARTGGTDWQSARAHLRPVVKDNRSRLNQPGGYGVFSLIPPPASLVISGSIGAVQGMLLLFASDGFMRLNDVFQRYTIPELASAAAEHGLAALLGELRAIERKDAACQAFLRSKPHDDASAMLIRIVDVPPLRPESHATA